MTAKAIASKNWFKEGGQAYARFRPEYPFALARFLAEKSPARNFAVDVGCGNGQLTNQLADHFDEVIGASIPALIRYNTPRPTTLPVMWLHLPRKFHYQMEQPT